MGWGFLDADSPQIVALAWRTMGWGFLLAVVSLGIALFAWRQPAYPSHRKSLPGLIAERPGLWLLLAGLVIIALIVRIQGLDAKGLSHPEIYIPGINLPPYSEPPDRTEFFAALRWHLFSETHPFGYYMGMWGWTKLFGASAFSIRLPEAIAGGLSVAVIYRVGALAFDRRIGIIAAAMLSLHGFHIFWSQAARMYSPGLLFGLMATMFLLEAMREVLPRRWVVPGYVLSFLACATTVEFAWPLLAMHMAWLVVKAPTRNDGARLAMTVSLAAIVAFPLLSAADVAPKPKGTPMPSLEFLMDYFSFGFLYEHGAYGDPTPGPLPVFRAFMTVLTLGLVALGLWRRAETIPASGRPEASSWRSLVPLAIASAIIMTGFAFSTLRHRHSMVALILLPFLGLLLPVMLTWASTWRWPRQLLSLTGNIGQNATGLVALLAFGPMIGVVIVSFVVPMMAPRAFLIFVPYVLIIVAAGVSVVFDIAPRPVSWALGAGLLLIFACSVVQERRIPMSPRDYRGIGQAMTAHLAPEDRVWVQRHSWQFTPLSVYVPRSRIEGRPLAAVAAEPDRAPIWVVQWYEGPCKLPGELAGYRWTAKLTRQQATACRYVPPEAAGAPVRSR